jgi:hypothetical protein
MGRDLDSSLAGKGAVRLRNQHEVALFTNGLPAYRTLFPELFGYPYYPPRQGTRGPQPQARFRIPRTAAHAQIVLPTYSSQSRTKMVTTTAKSDADIALSDTTLQTGSRV